jgi:hypothetical protein
MSEYKERVVAKDRRKIRNLKQYKDLSEDAFNDLMDREALDIAPIKEFEDRIERKLKSFEEDYDLSDMKFNDRETLRALAQSLINLEDLEQVTYSIRAGGINLDNLTLLDKITQQMSRLRADISKMQDDLKISRKVRKSDEETSVIAFLDNLKEKAKKFYEQKMFYVFCESCNELLATTWFLWPDGNNKMSFTCNRRLDDGAVCGHKTIITSSDLKLKKGTNKPDVMPEVLK